MSVSAPCSEDVLMRNYENGPKRSRGTTRSPGNWIMKSIDAAWLVSFMAFHFFGCGTLFLIPFFDFHRGIQGVRFSTNSAVACPPVSLPSTCQTQLGRAVLGSKLFVLIFCLLDSWEYVENQPVCHIYQRVAHPTHGGVCNHCERMMDGLRIDDIISGNREGSLTEDEIVEIVQNGDPNHRDWDDWPLRMTFRINSFLRAHGPVGDVDLAALGFLEDD